jgi:hypothetical protein
MSDVGCAQLCSASAAAFNVLKDYTPEVSFDRFQAMIAQLESEAGRIRKRVETYLTTFPTTCHPTRTESMTVINVLREFARALEEIAGPETAELKLSLTTLRSELNQFKAMRNSIESVLKNPEAFTFTYKEIGGFSDPTEVSIKLEREEKAGFALDATAVVSPPRPIASKPVFDEKIIFGGGPRFMLSGGITFAALPRKDFIPVPLSFRRDANGNLITDSAVVGLRDESDFRFGPIVMLNVRHRNSQRFFYSLGITARKDNESTDIEYMFGVSINIWEGKMFLSPGLYYGREFEPAGGLEEGSVIPPSLLSLPIPVRKDWKFRPALAVMFKIR